MMTSRVDDVASIVYLISVLELELKLRPSI